MSEPINGSEQIAEAPAPEPTLRDVFHRLEVLSNSVGVMLLAMSRYPLPRELMVQLVKMNGVEFDESKAFREDQRIVIPGGPLPKAGH